MHFNGLRWDLGGWRVGVLMTMLGGSAAMAGADLAALPAAVGRPVDFEQDIRPLFESRCWDCHGPERQKGGYRLDRRAEAIKGGDTYTPAIKPGQSAESPLIQLVAGLKPDLRMPLKGEPLSAGEVGLLRAWIDQGAPWPETQVSAPTNSIAHWSLQPVQRPAEPEVTIGKCAVRNPIDRFIQARLAEHQLIPSPEADRRTLIRRLYFDLLGLPPSPEAVRAFEEDAAPEAYERLVDRLLVSPHYGERWARHWLDVVRFAESHGFEMNQPRPNAWPYRDYVIEAFNTDKSYPRFVQEQLAGDVLEVDAASGFLVAGAWDQVKSPDAVLTANQRADELHDMVSTTGSAFLGLTVGCARCHNHKFDPIPQVDYYALKAVFAGVQHGEREWSARNRAVRDREVEEHRRQLTAIEVRLADWAPLAVVKDDYSAASTPTTASENESQATLPRRLRSPVNAGQNFERFKPAQARWLRFTILRTTGEEPCLDELEVFTDEPSPRNIALAGAGTKSRASSVFPNSDLHRLEHINDGRYGNGRSWISNERGQGWVELEFPEVVTINKVIWGRDRDRRFQDRLALEYRIEVATATDEWHVVASSTDRQPYQADCPRTQALDLTNMEANVRAQVESLLATQAQLEARLRELTQAPMVYAGVFEAEPSPTHRLQRGDPMQPREIVMPGALSAVRVKFDLEAATCLVNQANTNATNRPITMDQRRRLALANWIVDPANPLPARVWVNRLWQYHFGEGLVSTPSDFGINGARPTHPELLDWLAAEFMQPQCPDPGGAHPWSTKHLQRLIVTSATYRQSSAAQSTGLAMDATARWLWRFPPRRLEAEPIRDAVLVVSGRLDEHMGGPGFSFFAPNDNYVRVYAAKQEYGPADWRRMIYGTVIRQRPDSVFGVFDCPDGGQIAPKRTRSTTPLQALNLLNSSWTLQQAGFLAERLAREAGPDTEAQVRRAFVLAFQREAEPEEMSAAVQLVREQGVPAMCRAMLNANEFVYLF